MALSWLSIKNAYSNPISEVILFFLTLVRGLEKAG